MKYEFKLICNSEVYAEESDNCNLLGLCYLVLWKGYSKEKNTLKPISTI